MASPRPAVTDGRPRLSPRASHGNRPPARPNGDSTPPPAPARHPTRDAQQPEAHDRTLTQPAPSWMTSHSPYQPFEHRRARRWRQARRVSRLCGARDWRQHLPERRSEYAGWTSAPTGQGSALCARLHHVFASGSGLRPMWAEQSATDYGWGSSSPSASDSSNRARAHSEPGPRLVIGRLESRLNSSYCVNSGSLGDSAIATLLRS
jgi:hypothetical protein